MTYRGALMPYRGALMPLLFLVAVSCEEAGFGLSAPVASVRVSPASVVLSTPGDTLRLTAAAQDARGGTVANATFRWASSDTSVVAVDGRGVATAVGAGAAAVIATERSSGLTGTAPVLVAGGPRDVLLHLHAVFGGSAWTRSGNWGSDAPLDTWHGVSTDDEGRVIGLELSDNGLAGSIPPVLGTLSELRTLDLTENDLTGPIPRALADLRHLRELRLGRNDLTGPIPRAFGNLAKLEALSLSSNDLTGRIPRELANLAELRDLWLSGNDLTGSIPPELGDLSGLESLIVRGNDLTGRIPPELGRLSNLRTLSFSDNDLTGPIPPELGSLENLTGLSLSRNRLDGPIPPELGALSKLEQLWLYLNDLEGPIPPELGRLSALDLLSLARNDLSGALPPDIGRLGRLEYLNVTANGGLHGALPMELAGLDGLTTLLARGTGLCAPPDADFQGWLRGVEDAQVAPCERMTGSRAYVIQTVQSLDYPVPLVAGEQALLRVFVVAGHATDEGIPPVRATFYLGGIETHRAEIPAQPTRIPTWIAEETLEATANALIPGAVVQPGLEMVVEIDPDGTLDPELGVTRRIPETGRTPVDVREMPALDLTVVPFLLRGDPDRSILDITSGLTAEDDLLWPTRTLLPVARLDLTVHESVLTSSDDGLALLRETAAIRTMEGGSGHYLGTRPWPVSGGFAGWASIGGRVSFAIPDSTVIAHELGHNMSLRHAPCGDPDGVDAGFPNTRGITGAWGYNFEHGTLRSSGRYDLMSYCHPRWISDYGFAKALRYRLEDEAPAAVAAAGAAAPAPALLLWGGVDERGSLFLEPAFVVSAPPRLPGGGGGPYQVTGRTAAGAELFSIRFDMEPVADGNGASLFVATLPVGGGWADSLAQIRLTGPEGVAVLDESSDRPMAILRDPASGRVRGILRGAPPLTLAERDLASAATEPGLDVLFSRGLPGASAWRR
ncbi:Ig-like domain-containing protein [Candidatus Palauibacter sp.]|uniref:Ig-like domain-containing protein n=1 Tax=Candidatus Palauibacter sp. TaxID=3101350 RepID=UPI003B01702E